MEKLCPKVIPKDFKVGKIVLRKKMCTVIQVRRFHYYIKKYNKCLFLINSSHIAKFVFLKTSNSWLIK